MTDPDYTPTRRTLEEIDNDRFDRLLEYGERSIIIAIGVSATALAGFLSQVWATGGIPFRTELAELIVRLGELFTLAFFLPVARYATAFYVDSGRWRAIGFLACWLALTLAVFVRFLFILNDAGATLVKFAKMASS